MEEPQYNLSWCRKCCFYEVAEGSDEPISCETIRKGYHVNDGVPCPGYLKSIEKKKACKLKELSGN